MIVQENFGRGQHAFHRTKDNNNRHISIEGLDRATADQQSLVDAALEHLRHLRNKNIDVTNLVLAKAQKDSRGHPWSAFVYSADAGGNDLRLVGHTESEKRSSPSKEAMESSKEVFRAMHALERLQNIQMPPGRRVGLGGQHRTPAKETCVVTAETDSELDGAVLRAVRASAGSSPDALAVGKVLKGFEKTGPVKPLRPVSLGDVLRCHSPRHHHGQPAAVHIVQGVDAFQFGRGRSEFIDNSVLQVASQFNFLESTSPAYMPLHDYAHDRTQGPQASLGCPGMLVQRNASFRLQPDLDIQPFFRGLERAYRGGYFSPSAISNADLGPAVAHVANNWRDLRVLAQSGRTLFGTETTQVFMAAPSFQNERRPAIETPLGKICEVLVSRQYEALGALAARQSLATRRRVNLHVTMVGQGAFQNPPEVMRSSFQLLLKAVGGYDVAVYVHAWMPAEAERARAALSAALAPSQLAKVSTIPSASFYRV